MTEAVDFRKNKQFWLLSISSTLFFSSFNMLIPELPSYLENMGGAEYKGLIIALFTVTALLARPFSGKLTDTIGRIPVMIFGAAIGIVAGVLYPLLTTVSGFLLLRLFHGLSTGFKPTATSAFASDIVSSKDRGVAMGILGVFTSAGMAIGPMMGPMISDIYGINGLFYASAVLSFLSVAVIFGMKETIHTKEKMSVKLLKINIEDFFEIRVLPVAITFLLTVIPFGIILTLIPDLSDHVGIPNRGSFYTIFVISSILIRLVAGKVSDIYGRVPILIASSFLIGVSIILISITTTPSMFYFSASVFGIAAGMNSPTIFAWNIDRSNENFRGRAMATLYMFLEFGIGFGAAVSGWIYGNNPDYFIYAFGFGAISSFAATAYLLYFHFNISKR